MNVKVARLVVIISASIQMVAITACVGRAIDWLLMENDAEVKCFKTRDANFFFSPIFLSHLFDFR